MSDPLTIAFDTSAAHCAAALLSGDRVLAARHEVMARGQGERLMGLLQEMLAAQGAGFRDLDMIGVGIGPGNFTGIRISVAAARGLALATGAVAVGVSRLEALAHGVPRPAVSCVDARRDAVYVQVFRDEDGAPAVVPVAALAGLGLPMGAACTGDAAALAAAACGGAVVQPAMPLAEAIGRRAEAARGAAPPRPAPLYLRPADAAPAAPAPTLLP